MTRMPLKRKRVVEDVIAAPGMGKEPVSKNNKPGTPAKKSSPPKAGLSPSMKNRAKILKSTVATVEAT